MNDAQEELPSERWIPCEVCGAPIGSHYQHVTVDGAVSWLCAPCGEEQLRASGSAFDAVVERHVAAIRKRRAAAA